MIEKLTEKPKPKPLFKKIAGNNGVKWRYERLLPGTKRGSGIDIEHNGGNHLLLDFRELYETPSGAKGNKRVLMQAMNAQLAVQFASIIFHVADEHLRDSSQEPYYTVVSSPEKAAMGPNWLNEDYQTAARRTALRESRGYVFNLMKQFVETCEDEFLFQEMARIFIEWGAKSENTYHNSIAEKAKHQVPNYID